MKRIGRYELAGLLGSGGQGRVYDAVLHGPAGLRKRVALKVLSSGDGLVREARMGGLLRHPNLVDVYEVGEDGGVWFAAMELCRGGSLATRVPLSTRAVVDVGLQVCAALGYAHDALGLVHLDLKPQNLLLSGAVVKVADLGLARARGFEKDGARVAGTRGYMAPEQLCGGALDARTDVYALGVVLAVLSTGKLPGRSETFTLDAATMAGGPADGPAEIGLGDVVLDELGDLGRVVARCLEVDPADRYASMAELADALATVDADGPGLAAILGDVADDRPADVAPEDDFVGRRGELDALTARLSSPGTTSLRGPAGIGKTRLAREALRAWTASGRPGWLVGLADARTAAAMVAAVAQAIGLQLHGFAEDAQRDMLGHALGSRGDALLVLDSVEAVAGAPEAVARWRASAPGLRVVATGREALRGSEVIDVDVLDEGAAVSLVTARALERGVVVSPADASAIARRVDGVPLAIELAAGRLGVLSAAEVLERLDLSLLRSGRAGLPDRHATLRGALDWSWDLLDDAERAALAALSVFAGGFTLAAAEAVVASTPTSPWVVDVLQSLADKSLVRRVADDRFGLLGAVRDHARERLVASGAATDAEARHGRWFAAWAGEIVPSLGRHGGAARRHELFRELHELVVGCRRALSRGDFDVAVDLLDAAGEAWRFRGPFRACRALAEEVLAALAATAGARAAAGRRRAMVIAARAAQDSGDPAAALRWLDDVLASEPSDRDRVVASVARGGVLDTLGRTAEAAAVLERAVDLAARIEDPAEGIAWRVLGSAWQNLGRTDDARAAFRRALALHREAGSRHDEGLALGNLGHLERTKGHVDEARACLEAAREVHVELGNRRAEGVTLWQLGALERGCGRLDEAEDLIRRSLAVHREVGNRRFEALAYGSLANVLIDRDDPDGALPLYEQALALHRETGNRRDEGVVLGNLGYLCSVHLGRYDDARRWCDAALDVHRQTGNREQEGVVLGYHAVMLQREGRTDEGLEVVDRALALDREVGNPREEAVALQTLALLLRDAGRLDEARQAADRALALHAHTGNARGLRQTRELRDRL